MQKKIKQMVLTGILLFCAVLLMSVPVQAAKKYKNTWRTQNGKVYYYNAKGKKVTGLQKIGKKQYYFDSKGVQLCGWQKIGKWYYYFNIAKGKKASSVKSTVINGIPLSKRGRTATKNTQRIRRLNLMVTANQTVQKITTPLMSKKEKLKTCFEYTKRAYGYLTWRRFAAHSGWELDYAEDMFYRGKGNCFSYGAAFAFMANAIGYKEVCVVSSGGHGWAEINGKIYDPDWALVSSVDSYYAMSYSLSGVQGRPNYAPNRIYVARL